MDDQGVIRRCVDDSQLRPAFSAVVTIECGRPTMDPQSNSFTPLSNNETWRLQNDLAKVQQIQVDHHDRIARLERRQDDDARMKSLWGSNSPFPSVLGGTPQQGLSLSYRDSRTGGYSG